MAHGRRSMQEVLDEAVQHFRQDYISAAQKQGARARLSWLGARPCPHACTCRQSSIADSPWWSCEARAQATSLENGEQQVRPVLGDRRRKRSLKGVLPERTEGVPVPCATAMMLAEVGNFFGPAAGGNAAALPPGEPLGPCPACGLDLLLCRPEDGTTPFVACSGTPAWTCLPACLLLSMPL